MKKILALFLAVIICSSAFACAKRGGASGGKTETTSEKHNFVGSAVCGPDVLGGSPKTTESLTPTIGATVEPDCGLDTPKTILKWQFVSGNYTYAKTTDGRAYVICNKQWSASVKPVSYGKVIFSEAEIKVEMKEVCESTGELWESFDEFFFEDNVLVYLTVNTSGKPYSVFANEIVKGEKADITLSCVATNSGASDMRSYTVLVILPKDEATGNEQINVNVAEGCMPID